MNLTLMAVLAIGFGLALYIGFRPEDADNG